jgi:flagellar assembly factor FliW
MSESATKYFGAVQYDEKDVFRFPIGLPGFENETAFVPLKLPHLEPLVFLQSLLHPELCFLSLPVFVVDSAYQLAVAPDDLNLLGLSVASQPIIGSDVLVLVLLSVPESESATANLMAPIVVNLKTRQAVQAVRCDLVYSHQQSLPVLAREQTC